MLIAKAVNNERQISSYDNFCSYLELIFPNFPKLEAIRSPGSPKLAVLLP